MLLLGETQKKQTGTSHPRYQTCPLHPIVTDAQSPRSSSQSVVTQNTQLVEKAAESERAMNGVW